MPRQSIAGLIVFGLIAAAPAPGAQETPGREVTVMTYNIHHGTGNEACSTPPTDPGQPPKPDCGLDLPQIARVIRDKEPDIVGLQEVDRFWARSGGVDQAASLAAELGMQVCYGANLSHEPDDHATVPHEYGTAVLSRFPILDCTNRLLPRGEAGSEQRGLLAALIDVRGVRLRFYNTHLHTRLADRRVQIEEVVRLIGMPPDPVVLLGDFNAQPDETTMAPVYARFDDVWLAGGDGGPGHTSPAEPHIDPRRRIDYIFVSKDVGVSLAQVPISTLTRLASDHYPVIAWLTLME